MLEANEDCEAIKSYNW